MVTPLVPGCKPAVCTHGATRLQSDYWTADLWRTCVVWDTISSLSFTGHWLHCWV